MQHTISNNDSWLVLPYHAKNQEDFDNPLINGRGFIYLDILKMSFTL